MHVVGKMIEDALSFAFKQCMHTELVNRLQKGSKQWSIIQNGNNIWQSLAVTQRS